MIVSFHNSSGVSILRVSVDAVPQINNIVIIGGTEYVVMKVVFEFEATGRGGGYDQQTIVTLGLV